MPLLSFFFQKPKYLTAILNFMLPGLGYLSLQKWFLAVPAFLCFSVFLGNPSLRWAIFWLALGTGMHGLWLPDASKVTRMGLKCYSAVGSVCFLGWVLLSSPVIGPIGAQVGANEASQKMRAWIGHCRGRLGTLPEALRDCPGQPPPDPWGRPFRYRRGATRFTLVSAGRDGLWDTSDDFRYSFR